MNEDAKTDYTKLVDTELVHRNRISKNQEYVVIGLAWCVEAFKEFLIFLGYVASPFFIALVYGCYIVWFYKNGVKLFKISFGKILWRFISRLLLDLIPFADAVFLIVSTGTGNGVKTPIVSFISRNIAEARQSDEVHNQKVDDEIARRKILMRDEEEQGVIDEQDRLALENNTVGGEIKPINSTGRIQQNTNS